MLKKKQTKATTTAKKPEVTRTGNKTERKLLRKKKKRIDGTWQLMETKRKGMSQVALKHPAYDRTCPEI